MRFLSLASITAITTAICCGCSTPHHAPEFEKITIGMSEPQVIEQLGKPEKIAVQGGIRYLEYQTYFHTWKPGDIGYEDYYVRLINGKVESFGKKGDFNSVKDPTQRLIVEQTVESRVTTAPAVGTKEIGSPAAFDLSLELTKLEKLKRDGLITEKEHQELRQRAIDKAKAQ